MQSVQLRMYFHSLGSESGHRRPQPSLSPAPPSSPPRVLHLEDKEMLQSYARRSYCIHTTYNKFLPQHVLQHENDENQHENHFNSLVRGGANVKVCAFGLSDWQDTRTSMNPATSSDVTLEVAD